MSTKWSPCTNLVVIYKSSCKCKKSSHINLVGWVVGTQLVASAKRSPRINVVVSANRSLCIIHCFDLEF